MFHFKSVFTLSVYQCIVLFRFFLLLSFHSNGVSKQMPRLKSAHDFGRPGKQCTGPVHNVTEQDLEVVDELEHTDEVGATGSPQPDVLQSLT